MESLERLVFGISIHALREESDMSKPHYGSKCWLFQSTLSVRRATTRSTGTSARSKFQSTLSVRRATKRFWITECVDSYFNPRSP